MGLYYNTPVYEYLLPVRNIIAFNFAHLISHTYYRTLTIAHLLSHTYYRTLTSPHTIAHNSAYNSAHNIVH